MTIQNVVKGGYDGCDLLSLDLFVCSYFVVPGHNSKGEACGGTFTEPAYLPGVPRKILPLTFHIEVWRICVICLQCTLHLRTSAQNLPEISSILLYLHTLYSCTQNQVFNVCGRNRCITLFHSSEISRYLARSSLFL